MSDSESDISFESADEGEDESSKHTQEISAESMEDSSSLTIASNKDVPISECDQKIQKNILTDNNKIIDEISNDNEHNFTKANFELKTKEIHEENLITTKLIDNKNEEYDTIETDSKSDCSGTFSKEEENNKTNDKEKPPRVRLKFEQKLLEKSQKQNAQVEKQKEKETEVLEKLSNVKVNEETSSGWGWSGWKSSLLSTAASSVSVFTSQVSQGIGTVIETMEATLGAPPPEELAESLQARKEEQINIQNEKEDISEDKDSSSSVIQQSTPSLFDGVTSFSKVIENTGTKVIMGGLDTLELIGKKTIDIITEGDPGLRKKRSYFSNETNLSEILREAKEKEIPSVASSDEKADQAVHYSILFDNFQGLAHLEALELLSRQSKMKLQELLISHSGDVNELQQQLDKIQEICEDLSSTDDITDEEIDQDFINLIDDCMEKLKLDMSTLKIKEVQERIHKWLQDCQKEQDKGVVKDHKELYLEALTSLAELTARSIELFHKLSELLLTKSSAISSTYSYATHLTNLTGVLCFEVRIIASEFSQCLNTAADDSPDPDAITPSITNVYFEASNSMTYIQDAFQLLIPVFQVISIK